MQTGIRGRWGSLPGRLRGSSAALVAVNAVPLLGVLFFEWDVYAIVALFWAENLVIGVENLVRMAAARGGGRSEPGAKVFLLPFFLVHYGGFCLGHGIFVAALFGPKPEAAGFALPLPYLLENRDLLIALGAIAASHFFSLAVNYFGGGEYREAHFFRLMFRPYGRVVALHVALLLAAGVITSWGSPPAGLAVLVIMKTALDLLAHLRSHPAAGGTAGLPEFFSSKQVVEGTLAGFDAAAGTITIRGALGTDSCAAGRTALEAVRGMKAGDPVAVTVLATPEGVTITGIRPQVPAPGPGRAPVPASRRWNWRAALFGALFLLVGAALIFLAGLKVQSTRAPIAESVRTQGQVIRSVPVAQPPPRAEIRSVTPERVRIGEPVTLQTGALGPRDGYQVSIGGHGISVPLDIVEWTPERVIVTVPPDPRIQPDRSYYFRITVRETHESSNLWGFWFEPPQQMATARAPAPEPQSPRAARQSAPARPAGCADLDLKFQALCRQEQAGRNRCAAPGDRSALTHCLMRLAGTGSPPPCTGIPVDRLAECEARRRAEELCAEEAGAEAFRACIETNLPVEGAH